MKLDVCCSEIETLIDNYNYTMEDCIPFSSDIFKKNQYSYVIDSGSHDKHGNQMHYGLYIVLVISAKNNIVNLLTCEFYTINDGAMIYNMCHVDYHLFYKELKTVLTNHGLPF